MKVRDRGGLITMYLTATLPVYTGAALPEPPPTDIGRMTESGSATRSGVAWDERACPDFAR
jgi:hypothetical protein